MPLPLLDHLLSRNFHLSTRSYVLLCLSAILLLLRTWTGRPLPHLNNARRIRNQTVLLVDSQGFSLLSLPLVEVLIKRSCQVVMLVSPKQATSERVLQLFALLKENGPVKHAQLFIEPVDLSDPASVASFAEQWAKRGQAKKGLMGEDIGQTRVAGIVFIPDETTTVKQKIALLRALKPTLVPSDKAPPDPLLQAPTQPRAIHLVSSPFYAAASASNSLSASATTAPRSPFQARATQSLKEIVLWQKAAQEFKGAQLYLTSLSTGLTRPTLLSTLDFVQVSFVKACLLAICFPAIWALGRSNSEAASSVEWLLIKGQVEAGAFYRDGRQVKLKEMDDAKLIDQLWKDNS